MCPLKFRAWGKTSSLASYRVKEGGIERLIVALLKKGGRVKSDQNSVC